MPRIKSSSGLFVFLCMLALMSSVRTLAQLTGYRIIQITTSASDHRWPALSNNGTMAWCEPNGMMWQVFKNGAPLTAGNEDCRYPAINDSDVVYVKYGVGGGVGRQLIRHPNGVIQFSSRDRLSGAHRDAGEHAGISSTGNIISYYDWWPFAGFFQGRRLSTSNAGQILEDLQGDYPDINASGDIVFASNGITYTMSEAIPTPDQRRNLNGDLPRINDNGDIVVIDGARVMVYSGQDYTHTLNVFVHSGVWADINNDGDVLFEDVDANNNHQIYLATQRPIAKIDGPDHLKINEIGQFSGANSQVVSGGRISAYQWTFETANGSDIKSSKDVSYAWGIAGIYNVTLTVTDDSGRTSTDSKKVTVDSFITIEGPATVKANSSPDKAGDYQCIVHGLPGGDQDVTAQTTWFVEAPHTINTGQLVTADVANGSTTTIQAVFSPPNGFPLTATKTITLTGVSKLDMIGNIWATIDTPNGLRADTVANGGMYYVHMILHNPHPYTLSGRLTLNDQLPVDPEPLPNGWGVFTNDAAWGGQQDFNLASGAQAEYVFGPVVHRFQWIDPEPSSEIGTRSELLHKSLDTVEAVVEGREAAHLSHGGEAAADLAKGLGFLASVFIAVHEVIQTPTYPDFLYSYRLSVRNSTAEFYQSQVGSIDIQVPQAKQLAFKNGLGLLKLAELHWGAFKLSYGAAVGFLLIPGAEALAIPAIGAMVADALFISVELPAGWAAYLYASH